MPSLGLGPTGRYGLDGSPPRPINPTYPDTRCPGPLPPVPQPGQRIKPIQVPGEAIQWPDLGRFAAGS